MNPDEEKSEKPIKPIPCKYCEMGDYCSRYMCDYCREPTSRGNWATIYARQKRRQGEAAAERQHRAIVRLLAGRDQVCTDTSTICQTEAYESQFPHWMSSAKPNSEPTPNHEHKPWPLAGPSHGPNSGTNHSKISRPCGCRDESNERDGNLLTRERVQLVRTTSIRKSKVIPWSKQKPYPSNPVHAVEEPVTFDTYDLCKEKPVDMAVGEWPADITRARTLTVWSNCR